MPSQDDIVQQQAYLKTHRQNLGQYLLQLATLGLAYAPPGLFNGIHCCTQLLRDRSLDSIRVRERHGPEAVADRHHVDRARCASHHDQHANRSHEPASCGDHGVCGRGGLPCSNVQYRSTARSLSSSTCS